MSTLSNNSLAFMALCNEYCEAVENAPMQQPRDFVGRMLKILPRLYVSATDLTIENPEEDGYVEPALEEEMYDGVRRGVAAVLGANDTYLEVFEENMKYSETPIGASVSENLADIYQVCYNFVNMVKDAPMELVEVGLAAIKEDFKNYWGQVLCNVLRPLNQIYYTIEDTDEI